MSGILGIVHAGAAQPSEPDLGAMRDAMSYWGGDGERCWSGAGVALAHLHRSVTSGRDGGPASGALPQAGGVVVAADLRLDNRADLRRLLGVPTGRQIADEELVLEAYLRWGEGCADRLAGAFAVAIWDGRRKRLVCIRDHAGLRPFAYWEGSTRFVFATDDMAVAACDDVPRRADEEASAAWVARNPALFRDRTLFEGVRKLPPGELLTLEPGRAARRTRWWFPERLAPSELRNPDECAEALRETLALAVSDAVDCAAPVGVHLSGGLDTSAMAALAQRALGRTGRALKSAYSWSPPPTAASGTGDEYARIEAIARALAVDVSYTTLSRSDLDAERRRTEALESDALLLFQVPVLDRARRDGVGALVTGWGGDPVASFNGRGQLAWLAKRGRWRRLWREAAAPARRRGDRFVARAAVRNIVRFAVPPLLPGALYRGLGLGYPRFERELERRGHGWAALHPLAPDQRRQARRRYRIRPSPRATQLSLLRLGHVEFRIESWARAGARHGVDHRYPLLDRRVLELCLSLPEDVWLRDGFGRWIFRQAVAPVLPDSIAWGREKREPALIGSWLALMSDAQLEDSPDESALVRALRRRRQEAARVLSGR